MKSEITKINDSELIIYESKDGNIKLDVNFENETVWLTANQMAQIFNRDEKVIRKHINLKLVYKILFQTTLYL